MFSSNRFLHYFDPISFFLSLLISILGIIFIQSATYSPDRPFSLFFQKQVIGLAFALFFYFLFTTIEYRNFMRWAYFGYIGVLALLSFTLIKGSIGMGAQRWINLMFFKLQPSEIAKFLFPICAAFQWNILVENRRNTANYFMPLLFLLLISFFLIKKQPDLGTAIVLAISALILFWFAGMPRHYFIRGALLIIGIAPFGWYTLKPYQKNRIMVFVGQGDKRKERYQREQALIAIGSGGLTGKGFLKGTQNKLRFLPEGRTDFIFAVVCEEIGFLGALFILTLYFLLFARILVMIKTITDHTIQLLCIGILLPIIVSAFINICMVNGLLPIVGVPLPLMSYGLSNLWITWITLGLLQGIMMQRAHIGEYRLIYPIRN